MESISRPLQSVADGGSVRIDKENPGRRPHSTVDGT